MNVPMENYRGIVRRNLLAFESMDERAERACVWKSPY
jgi:hypothetical protein